jgi:hypothetical protein
LAAPAESRQKAAASAFAQGRCCMVFLIDVRMTGKSAAAIFAYRGLGARGTGLASPMRHGAVEAAVAGCRLADLSRRTCPIRGIAKGASGP